MSWPCNGSPIRHASAVVCALFLLGAALPARAEGVATSPVVATPGHKPRPSHKKVVKRHRGRALAAKAHHHPAHHAAAAEAADTDRLQLGEASWYGTRRTVGHRTASGERFDPTRLTAAHPSLPMNTEVRVENLANGRSVTVRINDRLPGTDNRVIDLSSRAAEVLGMKQRGVTRVAVVPLTPSR